jgi:hypothetical protein
MKDRLFKLLGIETEEGSMVSMLLMQSVFLGIYYGAFDISAHSLFLSVFDEKAMARAYVLSGLAGIILTTVYTKLQQKIPFRSFAIGNLSFVTIVTFILWVTGVMFPGKIVTFSIFILMGPLNILAMLGFWGTTGRLFTLRQGKRLFGLVDAGLIAGIIISCYTIPLLMEFGFQPHNILLLSLGSGIAAAVIQTLTGRKFSFTQGEQQKGSDSGANFRLFRENRYFSTMGLFVALSVATAFFVQYSFMAVTRAQYPLEADMARFLGLFTGSMMIFTLLVKLLAFSYIIRNYGLKTCLAITPVIVGGLTLIAILLGTLMGFATASSGFLLFFLLLALSRLFSKSLKDSIESPSFKVVYQTVDEKIRFSVQSAVDGTVNEISALFTGLLLAGLGALSFVKLIHFSWVLAVLLGLWTILAIRLYRGYRNTIRLSLESVGDKDKVKHDSSESVPYNVITSGLQFRLNYYSFAQGEHKSLLHPESEHLSRKLISHSLAEDDFTMLSALKAISESSAVSETLRQNAVGAYEKIELSLSAKSPSAEKRLAVSKLFTAQRQPNTTEVLRLLRDSKIEQKRYAILLIGKFRISELLGEVCNCLHIKELRHTATSVIVIFGRESVEPLSRLFMNSSGNTELGLIVIRLLAKCGGKDAFEFLFGRLWSTSRAIKELAVGELLKLGYRASGSDTDKLHQVISDVMGLITWNIAATITLQRANDNELLELVKRDSERWFSLLFTMLSLAYDPISIQKIRTNIENGTVGSMNYALEMIDMVIDDSVKGKLVYLIDTVPDEEKIKNLLQFYPKEIQSYNELIEDIINRDYNLTGLLLKAYAVRRADLNSSPAVKESVTALLFSPEEILVQEGILAFSRNRVEIPGDLISRLPAESVKLAEAISGGTFFTQASEWSKAELVAEMFPELSDDGLVSLATAIYATDSPGKFSPVPGKEYISWCSSDGKTFRQVRLISARLGEVLSYECRQGSAWYFLSLDHAENLYLHSPESALSIMENLEKLNPSITD